MCEHMDFCGIFEVGFFVYPCMQCICNKGDLSSLGQNFKGRGGLAPIAPMVLLPLVFSTLPMSSDWDSAYFIDAKVRSILNEIFHRVHSFICTVQGSILMGKRKDF